MEQEINDFIFYIYKHFSNSKNSQKIGSTWVSFDKKVTFLAFSEKSMNSSKRIKWILFSWTALLSSHYQLICFFFSEKNNMALCCVAELINWSNAFMTFLSSGLFALPVPSVQAEHTIVHTSAALNASRQCNDFLMQRLQTIFLSLSLPSTQKTVIIIVELNDIRARVISPGK